MSLMCVISTRRNSSGRKSTTTFYRSDASSIYLSRLNAVRKKHGLFAMKTRWHNRYLKESELRPFLKRNFVIEEEVNIGSLYYLVSRVVYAKLASMEKKEPSYAHPINLIASELPILGNFSPNFLYVLRKK